MAVVACGACNNKVEVSECRDDHCEGAGGDDGANNCAVAECNKEQRVQNLKGDFRCVSFCACYERDSTHRRLKSSPLAACCSLQRRWNSSRS